MLGAYSRKFEQTIRPVTKGAVDGDEGMLNYIDEGSIAYADVVLVLVDIRSVTWDRDTRGFLWKGGRSGHGADVLR